MSAATDATAGSESTGAGARGAAPRRGGLRLAAAALVATFLALGLWRAAHDSETYDEPMYLLTGYSYLVTGDLSFNREHPPLAKYLLALPLLALDLELPADYQVRPGIEFQFYAHQPRADARTMLFLARLPGLLLGVVLLLYVRRWGEAAFGARAGLVALSLAALNPNLIGHATTAGNDFALTVFGFAACYHLWRWLAAGTRTSLLFCAIALGLAIGSKLTALLLLPVFGVIVLGAALARRRLALLGWALLAGLAALGVLWLVYLGEARSLAEARSHPRFAVRGLQDRAFRSEALERGLESVFGAERPIPLLSFLKGIDHQSEHAASGRNNVWRGRLSPEGAPEFYAVGWLIKNPEGFSLLLLLGLVAWPRTRRGAAHEAALHLYPLLLIGVFSAGDLQLGFKYALPVVPFLAVAAGRALAAEPRPAGAGERRAGALSLVAAALAAWWWFGDTGAWRWSHALPLLVPLAAAALLLRTPRDARGAPVPAVALLAVWAGLGSLARQPHDLMYFNEWVGGPEQGWRWSVIGDDWGQGTAALGRWMAERDLEWIYYDAYTEGDPQAWGVRSRPTFGGQNLDAPEQPWVAVHVSMLVRFPEAYAFLAGKPPEEVIDHTIFVYRLTPEEMLAARTAPPRTSGF